ncbi:MAG: hypothetical protein K2X66_06845, partial [Cyanobacteria bacterium]|nr:hypothetical protein [Cyanobacteriota bacterium]
MKKTVAYTSVTAVLIPVLILILGGMNDSVWARQKEKRSDSNQCKQAYIEYRNSQDVLFGAAEGLKKCAGSSEYHNDCSTDFESVGTAFKSMQ